MSSHGRKELSPPSSCSSTSSAASMRKMIGGRNTATAWIALFMAVWSTLNMHYTRRIFIKNENYQGADLSRNSSLALVRLATLSIQSSDRHVAVPEKKNEATTTQSPPQEQPNSGGSSTSMLLSTNSTTTTTSKTPNSCVWGPLASGPCYQMLHQRLTFPLNRLLLLGDSTIHNIFKEGVALERTLVNEAQQHCPQCLIRTSERCDRSYGRPGILPVTAWVKPDLWLGIGPISTGYVQPGCSDCFNCDSRFLDCNPDRPHCSVRHGGYLYTEFARDVVWQSERYNTTQENTADLLRDSLILYPNTTCIMAAGLHDMEIAIPHDLAKFLHNVNWYLSLYIHHVCQHVVWLANASPMTDNYTQTIARTHEWNEGVMQMLHANFPDTTTFIDLWASSQTWEHNNNLHMDHHWNTHLTNLFHQL
jgi:hypothetical protein